LVGFAFAFTMTKALASASAGLWSFGFTFFASLNIVDYLPSLGSMSYTS